MKKRPHPPDVKTTLQGKIWAKGPHFFFATLVPEAPKTSYFSACGRHLYHCELRERARVPFQSQKGQKISACSRHLYYCKLRERLRVSTLSKPERPKNSALKLLSTERERLKASFQNQNGQKFCACSRHLCYCELRERG